MTAESYIHKLKSGYIAKVDNWLRYQLDSLIYNISSDWDFVIVITGDGMVRTGKSVLGLNVAAYMADKLNTPFDVKNNVHYDSVDMMNIAQESVPNSVYLYDEARRGLATTKRFSQLYERMVDFFNECGQLNHMFI